MTTPKEYKRIVLQERPVGDIEPNTFRTEVLPFDSLKADQGEVVVQITWLSLDPAMRGYLKDVRSYLPPVQIGEVRICVVIVFSTALIEICLGHASVRPWCCDPSRNREQIFCRRHCLWHLGYVEIFHLWPSFVDPEL